MEARPSLVAYDDETCDCAAAASGNRMPPRMPSVLSARILAASILAASIWAASIWAEVSFGREARFMPNTCMGEGASGRTKGGMVRRSEAWPMAPGPVKPWGQCGLGQ